jgi:hypothetical protein
MPRPCTEEQELRFEETLLRCANSQLGTAFTSVQQLVRLQADMRKRIDWRAVDEALAWKQLGQPKSYKHFLEVTVHRHCQQWPKQLLGEVQ